MNQLATAPKPQISEIEKYIPGDSEIAGIENAIKLSSNENPYGPSPKAIAAYKSSDCDLSKYPSSDHQKLKTAISEVHELEPDKIVCGAGSDELLAFICQSFAGPGDEVVYSRHGFLMYPILARSVGATPVAVPEKFRKTDVERMLAACNSSTRLVFVANPNNPTGTMLNAEELDRLANGIPPKALLVIDAAYAEYVDDYDGGAEIVRARNNTVMTRTFSKIHGLASLRVGYAFGPKTVIDAMDRMREPFNVSGPALAAAESAIRDVEFVNCCKLANTKWRGWLAERLGALEIQSDPSFANFLLARFTNADESSACDEFFKRNGIIVRRMEQYGLPDCLRITIGDESSCKAVARVLAQFRSKFGFP